MRQCCKWMFSSSDSQRLCDTPWSLLLFFFSLLNKTHVFPCLYLLPQPFPIRLPVLLYSQLWPFACQATGEFCFMCTKTLRTLCLLPTVCLSHQKPSSCISGTGKLWQELKFGWRTLKVFHLVWKKICAWMLTFWIFAVFIWFFWLDLKIRQLGWLDFLELSARLCSPHICLGSFQVLRIPPTNQRPHAGSTRLRNLFFYFLKLIQAMCELVICMSGMHLFTMLSKMSPPIIACLEMPLTGSGWRKRHVIETFPTAIRSFKVFKISWIFLILCVFSLNKNVQKVHLFTCFCCSLFSRSVNRELCL